MKKIFLIIMLVSFNRAYARSSGPGGGWGMEIDRESFGGGIATRLNLTSEGAGPAGFGKLSESTGIGGSGRIVSDSPGSFDIGGFKGIRTLDLPTSFNGNIGGRF
jgi:hypothetical protein